MTVIEMPAYKEAGSILQVSNELFYYTLNRFLFDPNSRNFLCTCVGSGIAGIGVIRRVI